MCVFWLCEFDESLVVVLGCASLVGGLLRKFGGEFWLREFGGGRFTCESLVVGFGCVSLVKVLVAVTRVW